MSGVIAYTTARSQIVNLDHFEHTPIVSLELPEGPYVVFGKVAFINFDDDSQDARVHLRQSDGHSSGPFEQLDETYIAIPAREDADRVAASVQAGVIVGESNFVDIACETYNGGALDAQLAAIRVEKLLA